MSYVCVNMSPTCKRDSRHNVDGRGVFFRGRSRNIEAWHFVPHDANPLKMPPYLDRQYPLVIHVPSGCRKVMRSETLSLAITLHCPDCGILGWARGLADCLTGDPSDPTTLVLLCLPTKG